MGKKCIGFEETENEVWAILKMAHENIDSSSVNPWKSSRVILLGDAHPVLGLGTNNAIEDSYVLSQALLNNSSGNYISCIQAYEMLKSRSNALRISIFCWIFWTYY
ncbi:6089_t:CDS:2 [Funneliformis caledonium]|uniref:6089_t:CDS:1 n=1 Tax=Funneliformis caledonium TaxID=1117310 RepID=A0A9N9FV16_9GLOM|nr:6089_t:CDS:2 [Funneliformis caledonium]